MEQLEMITAAISAQFDQQVEFLQQLVHAKSNNPFTPETAPPDVPVEKEVVEVICQELDSLGYRADLQGISSQRPNVLCSFPGSEQNGKTLVLTTHMDTVEPSQNYTRNPWGAQLKGGRLYGLGAADAKAQIAAFIYAIDAVLKVGLRLSGNLILAFVVDEETGACSPYGTRYLLKQGLLPADAVIVGEPGDDKIAIGHRGLYRFRLETLGEATHVGLKAWEQGTRGHNAILEMARIALALSSCSLPQVPSSIFPGRKSILTFPTLIQGGRNVNMVPDRCEACGDVRLLPGLTVDEVKRHIRKHLRELAITSYRLDDLAAVPAVKIAPSSEIVQALARAAQTVTGRKPRLEGAGPACDGWMFITRGIPAVCGYGVACGGVHGADEWIDLESLRAVTQVYAQTILTYLG
ncbi:MAG TPA: M20/M25/M40 family metallo-hydrolase [Ktedonobacteraceae bacterium]|jgi:acetylornithine deacetylase/succinyl-diaminopimelate desuccinylase-like protein|nr:M20/M25/M40 family metallo-hydrolase [Ktedonobacteraceae bacterium]